MLLGSGMSRVGLTEVPESGTLNLIPSEACALITSYRLLETTTAPSMHLVRTLVAVALEAVVCEFVTSVW